MGGANCRSDPGVQIVCHIKLLKSSAATKALEFFEVIVAFGVNTKYVPT